MSPRGSTGVVRKSTRVRCSVDIAFRTWVEEINAWWPKEHSLSGNPQTTIFIESRVGGRIYERTPDGVEHDWGRVTTWDPPRRFAYEWYMGSGPEQPTVVDVYFSAVDADSTQVDVTHRGPELIGELWSSNRSRYDTSWDALLSAYFAACNAIE